MAELSVLALAVRVLTTAFVVIVVAMAVGWFGPVIGGTLAGLPIVLGPGFYFLMARSGGAFVADAAAYALLSLCATQVFLVAYVATAGRRRPLLCLGAAVLAWACAAGLLRQIPPEPALGAILFVCVTWAARRLTRRFLLTAEPGGRPESRWLLAARGILAGALVAGVTLTAARLGPGWSGILLGFPVGFTVISVTIHQRLGRAAAIGTLYAAMLGVGSLAAFCGGLAVLVGRLPPHTAFLAALALSIATTAALTVSARLRTGTRRTAASDRANSPCTPPC